MLLRSMLRFAALALCAAACSRSRGVVDRELPGLVVEARRPETPIDVAHAVEDAGELGRALARPYRTVLQALGPHTASVNTTITVEESGKQVSDLSDHAQIENGSAGTYHALYTNSADYGRETTFVGDKLYLRPRYQRWHARAAEAPDEPAELRDQYFEAIAATWELLAPGAELADGGPLEIAGRRGRKIRITRAAEPSTPDAEHVAQRTWRETRSIDAVAGEIVLDAERGVPLAAKLTGAVGFARDGRRFTMKVSLDAAVSGVGTTAMITPPPDGEIVTTPERMREVDDRDFLLQGIAPPLRRNADGTAIAPAPRLRGAGPSHRDPAADRSAGSAADKAPARPSGGAASKPPGKRSDTSAKP